MSLCIVGNHSLDVLEGYARDHFSAVVDKDYKLDDFSNDVMYDQNTLGHIVRFVPKKESRELSVVWPRLPSIKNFWDGSPLDYISHVVGHEGKNSLLSELVKQDLAVSLSSGPYERMQHTFSGFELSITLTEKGMAQYEEVIRLIFAQINKMKEEGPQQHIFDEEMKMSKINFDYLIAKSSVKTSNSYAKRLNSWTRPENGDCKIEDILYKPYAYTKFRKEEIMQYLNLLTP